MTQVLALDPAVKAFEDLLGAARGIMDACPAMAGFNGVLPEATFAPRAPHPIPALGPLVDDFKPTDLDPVNARFVEAVKAVAPFAEWRRSYAEHEVGADFLARYGWFELLGPEGHFHCDTARAYVGYWGRDLYYPWHQHEAEEIYYCVAGGAIFEAEGDDVLHIREGLTKVHTSNQLHAMTTQEQPILTFVLWRGQGMAGKPLIPGS